MNGFDSTVGSLLVETHSQAAMNEPVKLTWKGGLGDWLLYILTWRYQAAGIMWYSHAALHQYRLDSAAASSQLKVD